MNMNKTTADTPSPALEETPQTTSSNKKKVISYFDATSGYTLCYDKPTANSTSTSTSNNTKSSIATTKDSSSTTSTTATNKDTPVPSDTPPTAKHSSTATNEDTISLDVVKSNTKSSTDTAEDNNSSDIAVVMTDSTASSTSTSMNTEDTPVPINSTDEVKKDNDTSPTVNHSSTTTNEDTSSLDVIMAYSTSTTITGDTSTFPSYLDDKEEVMEGEDMEEDTSEKKKVARYTDDITGMSYSYDKPAATSSPANIAVKSEESETYLANTPGEVVVALKQQMNLLKEARTNKVKETCKLKKKKKDKALEETEEYIKNNDVDTVDLNSTQANLLRLLTFANDELGIKDTSHLSCCYAGVYACPSQDQKEDRHHKLLVGVDGGASSSNMIKLVSSNEPTRKYTEADSALLLKNNGRVLDDKDLIITYLRPEWLDPKNQHELEKYIKALIQDAKKKGKIPIIVIAQHDIVKQQCARDAEKESIDTIQTKGFLSTEGRDYKDGDSSNSPIALSFLVLAIGTIAALEEGRISLSLGGTYCFQNEMIKRTAVAHTEDVWVFPVVETKTTKRKSKPTLKDTSPKTLPSELAVYKGVDFTGTFARSFSRALAQVELKELKESFNEEGKTLVVFGSGKESLTYTRAKDDPDNYVMMQADEFMRFGFGKK